MPETTVVNLRDKPEPGYVRIDRRTIWGNPFKIGPDGDRAEVIAKYREWVRERITNSMDPQATRSNLASLAGKRLACWCAPLPCHGDVLKEWADHFAGTVVTNG